MAVSDKIFARKHARAWKNKREREREEKKGQVGERDKGTQEERGGRGQLSDQKGRG
jgi:hypothetical protein